MSSRAKREARSYGDQYYAAAIDVPGSKDKPNTVGSSGTSDVMPTLTEPPAKASVPITRQQSIVSKLKNALTSDKEKKRRAQARQSLEKETWM